MVAHQVDMFPTLPRNSVVSSIREDWNRFKADQERLGGLMPASLAKYFLGVSKQRLHVMLNEGQLRYVTHDGYRYVSGDDIRDRIQAKRDGQIKPGRPPGRK